MTGKMKMKMNLIEFVTTVAATDIKDFTDLLKDFLYTYLVVITEYLSQKKLNWLLLKKQAI